MHSAAEYEPADDRQENQDDDGPDPSGAGTARWSLLDLNVRHFSSME